MKRHCGKDTFADAARHRYRRQQRTPAVTTASAALNVRLFDVGNMTDTCEFCQALHFPLERTQTGGYSTCCKTGKVYLNPAPDYPDYLKSLLTEHTPDGKNFLENIRQFNSAFAFASFGYKPFASHSRGPHVFVIHGQVYHSVRTNLLQPASGSSYSYLYILDPELALQSRMAHEKNQKCSATLMQRLDGLLREVNPFASAYKMLKDVLAESDHRDVQMWFTKNRLYDPRRYSLPSANEVAAVFRSVDGEPPFNRDICIHPKDGGLVYLHITSPNTDPMVYPLLFPFGDHGWQIGIKRRGEGRREDVSMMEFYGFKIHERPNVFNPILHSGKLTQQYIVDAYCKVEAQRLEWCRKNQATLRAELYSGLMDYVNSQAETEGLKPGKLCILPSSFIGGRRAMQQLYQDSMAIVATFGRPDLFITFTCNPAWSEIVSSIGSGQLAVDRPDIVATVFRLKLQELLKDIVQRQIFGRIVAFTYSIEFQKRGLPHCHMLFILANEFKLRQPEDVDKVVCAEIPNPESDPVLYEIVRLRMIHGPCGKMNPTSPCMNDALNEPTCTKRFPKSLSDVTQVNVDGYPLYRRRNQGFVVQIRGMQLDNRWVVPYNAYLLKKFNAHINVEICSSVKSIKYIFKYVYKGYDAALVSINESGSELAWDEIAAYLDARYIAAPEAMWRLREYKMHDKSHTVYRLAVHCLDQQLVYYNYGHEREALANSSRRRTTLTAWFELNKSDSKARNFLYTEIPYHYVFKANPGSWSPRQKGAEKIISRMYAVNVKDTERFCLRLLLLHRKGMTGFQDLQTVNGVSYTTFKETAQAMKLLQDNNQWKQTLDEAVSFQMPVQLRQLFVTIVTFSEFSNPFDIWQQYKHHLYEDYIQSVPEKEAENMALLDIDLALRNLGKCCSDFSLPTPVGNPGNMAQTFHAVAPMDISVLNNEQLLAFEIIMGAITANNGQRLYYISGPGGSGKTFLYKCLISALAKQGKKTLCIAPTGLASTLLPNGMTMHSAFKLPLDINQSTMSSIRQGSAAWKLLDDASLIVLDEISMCSKAVFECISRSLQDLLNSSALFGNKFVVVGGDFRQQLPVVPKSGQAETMEACVKSSLLWQEFRELKLTKNMRLNDPEQGFSKWLLLVGDGICANGKVTDSVEIPTDLLSNDIILDTFGDIVNMSEECVATTAILCPKNEETLRLNLLILDKLPGEAVVYHSFDKVVCDNDDEAAHYPTEFLNSLTPMGLPPHKLVIKKGCCVMLLRNLNSKLGLCNGTRMIVRRTSPNVLDCEILAGQHKGRRVLVPRISLDAYDRDTPFTLQRNQFPLRLSYVMTITKSQGQTFHKVGVYLREPVFTHGQLYTALSRVTSYQNLKLQVFQTKKQGKIKPKCEKTFAYNCVFREIL